MTYRRVVAIATVGALAFILMSHLYGSLETPESSSKFVLLEPVKSKNPEKATAYKLENSESRNINDDNVKMQKNTVTELNHPQAIAKSDLDEESMDGAAEEVQGIQSRESFEQQNGNDLSPSEPNPLSCNMDSCFDYSLCPITKPLEFYLYPVGDDRNQSQISIENRVTLYSALHTNEQRVDDPEMACIFISVVEKCNDSGLHITQMAQLRKEGRNHVIWTYCSESNATSEETTKRTQETMNENVPPRAIVVTGALDSKFRPKFDILTGHVATDSDQSQASPLLPARRKYLASLANCDNVAQSLFSKFLKSDPTAYYSLTEKECDQEFLRSNLLKNSTFSFLILPPAAMSLRQSGDLQRQLHELLKHGVIPVVIGTRFVPPFNDVLDWSKVMITVPPGRITEMDTILGSISDDDILGFKKNGWLLFQKYLSTVQAIADTVLGVLRTRIGLVPTPYQDTPSPSVYNDTFEPDKSNPSPIDPKNKDNTGPFPMLPLVSPKFKRNFTGNFLGKYDAWNTHYQPFKLYPSTPWDEPLPKIPEKPVVPIILDNQNTTARPPKKAAAGPYDGMSPHEQFTIVMLTYKRQALLVRTLQKLYPLPYLNKVVVVWNTPYPPPENLTWPDIGVPIEIIRPERNSLNNRFLPFDTIETEAIFSLDDDISFGMEEIVFGFRVWLENKDRIVGYPARLHKWNWDRKLWYYQPPDHCQISLVLTGAAFFHKIYLYKYTYEMPASIRNKVDELLNCEDIAMNFLIAHVTQKPPIKVTSKRNFDCHGCKSSLSRTGKHYEKRSNCMRFFEKVYGYMPLRYTISRMDSIFFKVGNVKQSNPPCFRSV